MKVTKLIFPTIFFGLFFAFATSVNAQESMVKKVEGGAKTVADKTVDASETVADKTVSSSKAVYKGGKRVGYTVGSKTWNGSKWVASKSWTGGKWVAVKTKSGTKWVYHKATGTGKRIP